MRKIDEDQLQKLYDDRRATIRQLLAHYGIHTEDDLARNINETVLQAVASLDFIVVEMCEMLKAVGYFGDNFYYIKHRIPMIQGKSYRNLLAHDSLSYYVLADSSDEIRLINAFVFAVTEVSLFDKRQPFEVYFTFPTVKETNRWNAEQQQLLEALKTDNAARIHEAMRSGGEITNQFCVPLSENDSTDFTTTLVNLLYRYCRPGSPVITLFRRYFDNFDSYYKPSEALVKSAFKQRDFDLALKHCGKNLQLGPEFFAVPELVSELGKNQLQGLASLGWAFLIKQLLDAGNDQSLTEVLPLFGKFSITEDDYGPAWYAILRGKHGIAKMLLEKTIRTHPMALELALVFHWNDLLSEIESKTLIGRNMFMRLLRTAIREGNDIGLDFLLTRERNTPETGMRALSARPLSPVTSDGPNGF
uniref:Uncharacterized protein n=1 Tax=Anopheles farauti TaxID=69004 RepID=A0A182QME1_9DIPT